MESAPTNLFDRIGGDALRVVITDFYNRLFGDLMIVFLFEGKDKARLCHGGSLTYGGT